MSCSRMQGSLVQVYFSSGLRKLWFWGLRFRAEGFRIEGFVVESLRLAGLRVQG